MNVGDMFDTLKEKLKTGEFSRIDDIVLVTTSAFGPSAIQSIEKTSGYSVGIEAEVTIGDCDRCESRCTDCMLYEADDDPATNWIPCARELPDADELVLIFSPLSDEPVSVGFTDGSTWFEVNGAELVGSEEVTHWQSFPEPP